MIFHYHTEICTLGARTLDVRRLKAETHRTPGADGVPTIPRSYAFFCERCGELWARRMVISRTTKVIHNVELRDCESCAGAHQSLFFGKDELLASLEGYDRYPDPISLELKLHELMALLR